MFKILLHSLFKKKTISHKSRSRNFDSTRFYVFQSIEINWAIAGDCNALMGAKMPKKLIYHGSLTKCAMTSLL